MRARWTAPWPWTRLPGPSYAAQVVWVRILWNANHYGVIDRI